MYTESLQKKVKTLSRAALENLAVQALFHLRCVSGSRNSYTAEYQNYLHDAGIGMPKRDPGVERMHQAAAEFIRREDA